MSIDRLAAKELKRAKQGELFRMLTGGFRSVTVRGRHNDGSIDTQQLYSRHVSQLRVLNDEAGGGPLGATEDDIGKLIFVVGYSHVDGGDFIPSG